MATDFAREQPVVLNPEVHTIFVQQLNAARYLAKYPPGIERRLEQVRAVRGTCKAGARIPFAGTGQ